MDWLSMLMNGLQTVGGGASQFFAPGNPMGAQMMMNGLSGFANNPSGFSRPGENGTPGVAAMMGSLPPWLDPSQIEGASNSMAGQNWLSKLGLNSGSLSNILGGLASGAGSVKPAQTPEFPQAPAFRAPNPGPAGFSQMAAPAQIGNGRGGGMMMAPRTPLIRPPSMNALPFLQALGINH